MEAIPLGVWLSAGILLAVLIGGFILGLISFAGTSRPVKMYFPILQAFMGYALFLIIAFLAIAMTDYTLTSKGWVLGALIVVLPVAAATAAVKESGAWAYWIIFLVTIVLAGVNYKGLWLYKSVQESKRESEAVEVDLGKSWHFQETIKEKMGSKKVGDYQATWARKGSTNNFDGEWKDGHKAELEVFIKGSDVTIFRRDHTSIVYKGTLGPDGRVMRGEIHSENWSGTWQAVIYNNDEPPTPIPKSETRLGGFSLAKPDTPPFFMNRLVNNNDLTGKSNWELDVMRNEIYARYGRRFERKDLQDYFNKQSWYRPKYNPGEFPSSILSSLQQRNVEIIYNYQKRMK